MRLTRLDPFGDLDTLFNRLMLRRFARWPQISPEGGAGSKLEWLPSADISETDKEYVIRAELPAVKTQDVAVIVDQEMITIKDERKQQRDDKNEKFHRVESFCGSFERSFSLPQNVNADAIRCESNDGILIVHIPKAETRKSNLKQISVQRRRTSFQRTTGI